MKKMTCRDMGGPCNMEMTANTAEEMMKKGQEHIMANHPDIAKEMDMMTPDEDKKWTADFMKKWDSTSDVK